MQKHTSGRSSSIVAELIKDMKRYPLLTLEEEQFLTRYIHDRRELDSKEFSTLSEDDRLRKVELNRALNKIVIHNLRLVFSIAKKVILNESSSFDFLDGIQEGTFGLRHAAIKFEPSKGYKFSTYATWWIRQFIQRGYDEQSRTVRLPMHVMDCNNKVKKSIEKFQKESKPYSIDSIALDINEKPERVRRAMVCTQRIYSMDLQIYEYDPLIDRLGREDSRSDFDVESFREQLELCLKKEEQRDKKIFYLHHGVIDGHEWTHSEIAERFGLDQAKVRRINSDMMRKVRVRSRMFESFK